MTSAVKTTRRIAAIALLAAVLFAAFICNALADEPEEGAEESIGFALLDAQDVTNSKSDNTASVTAKLSSSSSKEIELCVVFHDIERGYAYLNRLQAVKGMQETQTSVDKLAFDTDYEVCVVLTSNIESLLESRGLDRDSSIVSSDFLDSVEGKSNVQAVRTSSANIKTISSVSVIPDYTSANLIWNGTSGGFLSSYRVYRGAKLVNEVTSDVTGRDIRSCTVTYSYGAKRQKYSVCPTYSVADFAGNVITYEGAAVEPALFNGKTLAAPTLSVTKISKNRVSLKITTDAAGAVVYAKSGGKWKRAKAVSSSGVFSFYKKNASKLSYRAKASFKSGTKTYLSSRYSSTANPRENIFTTGVSLSASNYKTSRALFKVSKVYYRKGKIRVDGAFINTFARAINSAKFRVIVYNGSSMIGQRTITSKSLKKKTSKKVSFTLKKSKRRIDLQNGDISIGVVLKSMR